MTAPREGSPAGITINIYITIEGGDGRTPSVRVHTSPEGQATATSLSDGLAFAPRTTAADITPPTRFKKSQVLGMVVDMLVANRPGMERRRSEITPDTQLSARPLRIRKARSLEAEINTAFGRYGVAVTRTDFEDMANPDKVKTVGDVRDLVWEKMDEDFKEGGDQ